MNIMLWAYLDNNIGDDLMIKLIAEKFQEDFFYLYSDSSIITKTFSGYKNIIVKTSDNRKGDLTKMDIFLTIGGSMFQLVNRRNYIARIYKILRILKCRRNNIKVATLGCNLGPYTRIGKFLTRLELSKNDLVTVRDKESKKKLDSFNNLRNYYLADDIVYNYDDVTCSDKEGLGISVYRSTNKDENNFDVYKTLAMISDEYIEKTQNQVKLFAFDSEQENDLAAAHHIHKLARNKDSIEIIPYLGDEKSFLNEFKKCESMIAIRFHSAVLADIFNIPFLPIAYSNKMKNIMIDRKYKGEVIDLKDLTPELDIEAVTNKLINKKGLFNQFTEGSNSALLHFEEFEKLKKSKIHTKNFGV